MRTSEERVAELHRRMDALRHARAIRRYRLTCAAAYAACLAITVLLALGISRLPAQPNATAPGGMMGSMFTQNGTLGYIVVAVLALCLGALVTALCYRMKRRMEDGEKRNDRKN